MRSAEHFLLNVKSITEKLGLDLWNKMNFDKALLTIINLRSWLKIYTISSFLYPIVSKGILFQKHIFLIMFYFAIWPYCLKWFLATYIKGIGTFQ